jgi:hypothetical protein
MDGSTSIREWNTRRGAQHELGLPLHGDPERLAHVEHLPVAVRERPVEVVEEARERQLHVDEPQRHAGAHPPAGAERDELHVGASEVDGAAATLEPLRPERLGVAPVRGVPRDRPRVHQHLGAPGHVVAHHPARLAALPRQQERHGHVQPQRLLHHQRQVPQPRRVGLAEPPLLGFMGLAQLSYSNKSQENLKSPYKWMAKG